MSSLLKYCKSTSQSTASLHIDSLDRFPCPRFPIYLVKNSSVFGVVKPASGKKLKP